MQQRQHQRNVDNMLPIRTNTKRLQAKSLSLMLIITVTTLLFATFDIRIADAAAPAAAPATTQATPFAAAFVTANAAESHLAIGATSLAAAAAAAEAISTAASAATHGDEISIAAQSSANLLLEDMQHPGNMVNLTRHHDGDVFCTTGKSKKFFFRQFIASTSLNS